jgi:PTS system mannose-specific IID component
MVSMEATILQYILIFLFAFIAMVDGVGPKVLLIALPLLASVGIGLIFGNMTLAVMTGALIQLTFIAAIPIGGASPPDGTSAAIVGCSLAEILYTGGDLATYYTDTVVPVIFPFAVIVAVLGVQFDIFARTANIVWVRRAERAIERGDIGSIQRSHLLGFVPWGLSRAILCPIAIALGTPALGFFTSLATSTTGLLNALVVAGSVLPAVGLAVILSILPFRKMPRFFILGFVIAWLMVILAPYLGIIATALPPVLVATGVGFLIAFITTRRRYPAEVAKEKKGKGVVELKKIEKKDLSSAFRRYFFSLEASWNYERMQGLGYLFTMLPIIKSVHKSKEEQKNSMKLHMEFFNTNPFIASWIIGMNAKVEDEGASPETIRSLKVGYMGPLAGIGDSLIYFVIGGMAMILGSSMAYGTGDILGPLILWGIMVPLTVVLRFWFFRLGLRRGASAVREMSTGKGLKRVMELTGATGLTTIGAFIPIAVQVGIPVLGLSGSMLFIANAVSVLVIPLVLTLVAYSLARRGLSIVKTLLIMFVIGFALGLVGLLVRTIYYALTPPSP